MPNRIGVPDHAAPDVAGLVEAVATPVYETLTADRVEPKVRAATISSAVGGLVVWLLGTYLFHGVVPDAVTGLVGLLVTSAVTYTGGYFARHVDRSPAA
jgi:hypothetical protein